MTSSLNYIAAINVQAQYYNKLKNNNTLDNKSVEQEDLHKVILQNKCHHDKIGVNPYWINNVHCHASLSKHNYTKLY